MNTLYSRSTQSESQEAARLKVKIGRSYLNRKGDVIKITGETTLPGWPSPLFVDSYGRRYDGFGFSYDAEKFPYSMYDLVARTTKRTADRRNRTSKENLIRSLVATVRRWGSEARSQLQRRA
jgi:hypothetical protein